MFCPACGAADQSPSAYCKRCGEWLAEKKSFGVPSASKPEQRITTMIVFNGLSGLLALFSAIALYATYLNTPEAKWSVYAAGACCGVITIHQFISCTQLVGPPLVTENTTELLEAVPHLTKPRNS